MTTSGQQAAGAPTLEEYQRLRAAVERRQQEASRAEGVLEGCLQRLGEMGYGSLGEAEQGLAVLEARAAAAGRAYEEELARFKETWGEILGI